jgi:hypothetical protein
VAPSADEAFDRNVGVHKNGQRTATINDILDHGRWRVDQVVLTVRRMLTYGSRF